MALVVTYLSTINIVLWENKMAKLFYVYEIIDPRTNIVFYVGKGQGTRMLHHTRLINSSAVKGNRILYNKINEVVNQDKSLIYRQFFVDTESAAFVLEEKLIKRYGRLIYNEGPLCNISSGEEDWVQQSSTGVPVYQFTMEGEFVRLHRSIVDAGSSINKHANTILECCAKRSKHAGGFVWRYDNKFDGYPKKIFQYDDQGEFIKGFSSVLSAAIHCNYTKSQITNALRIHRAKGGDFYWRREYTNSISPHLKHTTGKQVRQLTLTGQVIAIFNSAREAVNKTGILGISNCILGYATSAGGYRWERVVDTNNAT